ncbi:hypothetical protein PWT90_00046 [Aphanocladium album]|nr:hypothetical protein PWT90_00046 [Aphanocladium album]
MSETAVDHVPDVAVSSIPGKTCSPSSDCTLSWPVPLPLPAASSTHLLFDIPSQAPRTWRGRLGQTRVSGRGNPLNATLGWLAELLAGRVAACTGAHLPTIQSCMLVRCRPPPQEMIQARSAAAALVVPGILASTSWALDMGNIGKGTIFSTTGLEWPSPAVLASAFSLCGWAYCGI